MRALCWHGTHDVRVENVPDPVVLHPRDAVVRITRTAICGSDLHLYGPEAYETFKKKEDGCVKVVLTP